LKEMRILIVEDDKKTALSNQPGILLDFAVFFAVSWIVIALVSSPFFNVHWFVPGDFTYPEANYYHAIMIPALILFYILTIKVLHLDLTKGNAFAVAAMLSVLFAGVGSVFNASKEISVSTIAQVIGMSMAELLGLVLVACMIKRYFGEHGREKERGVGFLLLLVSLSAILVAGPLGHLAGWSIDIGTSSIPGLNTWLGATKMSPQDFREGLVTSHSHLVMAALMSGLAAVAATYLHYQSRDALWSHISETGLWIVLVSLLAATGVYVSTAITGWEPPVLFASGQSGIPLDDVILTLQEIGFLVLAAGLFGPQRRHGPEPLSAMEKGVRNSIVTAWVTGFIGAVVLGVYIEMHEGLYGAGEAPAARALNDNIFIRAHMLFPFLILPVLIAITLAVGCRKKAVVSLLFRPGIFIWLSVVVMLLGLTGEILWFTTRQGIVFVSSMVLMIPVFMVAAAVLWPLKK